MTFRKTSRRKKAKTESDQAADQVEGSASPSLKNLHDKSDITTSKLVPPSTIDQSLLAPDHHRVVSHSQQTIPTPQVVFENNRHIIPENLFKHPSKRRNDRWLSPSSSEDTSSLTQQKSSTSLDLPKKSISSADHYLRPPLVKQHSSWGATTVNRKLQEQVLREVFSSPQIQQNHKHSRNHHALAHSETSRDSQYKIANKYATLPARRSSADLGVAHSGLIDETSTRKMVLRNEAERSWFMQNSSPKSETSKTVVPADAEDVNLARIHTEELSEAPTIARRIKRRHSGGGLRRRRLTVHGDEKAELAYFEDDGYGGDKEDEVFAMDEDTIKLPPQLKKSVASERQGNGDVSLIGKFVTLHLPNESTQNTDDWSSNELQKKIPSSTTTPTPDTPPATSGPCNPMEAQIQSDQRVEHFLLLEDVTAGMKRPCVLDLKMGTRQYGLDANKKKQESQRRKGAMTTSRQLGVRVCGMQVWNARDEVYLYQDKYFGRSLKVGREFQDALTRFLYNGLNYDSVLNHISDILAKLTSLETKIQSLRGYRFYASSLLILYDGNPEEAKSPSASGRHSNSYEGYDSDTRPPRSTVDLKIVDFANCVTAEDIIPQDTLCPPKDPDGVDRGFLRGLKNLKFYLHRIYVEINEQAHHPDGREALYLSPLDGKQSIDDADEDSDVSI